MSTFLDELRADAARFAESELPSDQEIRSLFAAIASRVKVVETKVFGADGAGKAVADQAVSDAQAAAVAAAEQAVKDAQAKLQQLTSVGPASQPPGTIPTTAG